MYFNTIEETGLTDENLSTVSEVNCLLKSHIERMPRFVGERCQREAPVVFTPGKTANFIGVAPYCRHCPCTVEQYYTGSI